MIFFFKFEKRNSIKMTTTGDWIKKYESEYQADLDIALETINADPRLRKYANREITYNSTRKISDIIETYHESHNENILKIVNSIRLIFFNSGIICMDIYKYLINEKCDQCKEITAVICRTITCKDCLTPMRRCGYCNKKCVSCEKKRYIT
jgi:hypothetical protein